MAQSINAATEPGLVLSTGISVEPTSTSWRGRAGAKARSLPSHRRSSEPNRPSDTSSRITAGNSINLPGTQPMVRSQALRQSHPYPGRESLLHRN